MGIAPKGVGINDELFWAKVHKTSECWLWLGALHEGYGWLTRKNQQYTAPRFSWQIHNGQIPRGKYVLHTCDNRACVNPAHLWLGSHADNMHDMKHKGRKKGINGDRRGETHGMHKLTEHDVIELRKMFDRGYPQREIAEIFETTQANVSYIGHRKAWKHVPS